MQTSEGKDRKRRKGTTRREREREGEREYKAHKETKEGYTRQLRASE